MNIIIPMAGRGTRMRPHTLTTPKPILPIAGKPIIERLLDNLDNATTENIDNIGFVIGSDFGEDIENYLLQLAKKYNASGHIYYQESPDGIAHAIYSAKDLLEGKTIIGLADTLFQFTGQLDTDQESILLVDEVEDPSSFGVVVLDEEGNVVALVEKPKDPISNLAIIGIYYFQQGEKLKKEIEYLLQNDIRTKGEYQITDAIEALRANGMTIRVQQVDEWLDCGNKDATVETNNRILDILDEDELIHPSVENNNSVIIPPCFIDKNVVLDHAIVGPHVSIGEGSTIRQSIVTNSIILSNTLLENKIMDNSMLGNYVSLKGTIDSISVGDYSFKE